MLTRDNLFQAFCDIEPSCEGNIAVRYQLLKAIQALATLEDIAYLEDNS